MQMKKIRLRRHNIKRRMQFLTSAPNFSGSCDPSGPAFHSPCL